VLSICNTYVVGIVLPLGFFNNGTLWPYRQYGYRDAGTSAARSLGSMEVVRGMTLKATSEVLIKAKESGMPVKSMISGPPRRVVP
jgi:hypothetical protein